MTICTEKDAFEKGFKKYYCQRRFGLVYVLPCTVGKKRMLAVCTANDVKKYGLKTRGAWLVLGDRPRDAENWQDTHDNPVLKRARESVRYARAVHTANRLEDKWREQRENA